MAGMPHMLPPYAPKFGNAAPPLPDESLLIPSAVLGFMIKYTLLKFVVS
jgi:hypothetical protein